MYINLKTRFPYNVDYHDDSCYQYLPSQLPELDKFDRNVSCVFGLPLDAVSMSDTVNAIHVAVET